MCLCGNLGLLKESGQYSTVLMVNLKCKLMFYATQNNIWPSHLWPYETVPIRIRTISSPSEGGRKLQRENH